MTDEATDRIFRTRSPYEEAWTRREELLASHGYKLRARLRKDWVPSWVESGKHPLDCEDVEILPNPLVDAYTDDGRRVYLKEVRRGDEESRIAHMLSTEEMRADPRNHCVPIIEIIDDPEDDTKSYIVMPLLRNAADPPFQYVKEIVDFVDQILEGLVFLHEKGVAHRDCVLYNLMMDADAMYPEGFHPIRLDWKPDYSGWAPHIPRSAAGVRYYFVDFGISVHIPEEVGSKFVTGTLGRDKEPPELSSSVPYDAFKLDIFIIGNMLIRDICNVYSNLEFLRPLAKRMSSMDPEQRPKADKAQQEWLQIKETISTVNNEWRPRPNEENLFDKVTLDVIAMYRFFMHVARACVQNIPG